MDMRGSRVSTDVEAAFSGAMKDIYRRAKVELGYNATYFLQMLANEGAVATARHLVMSTRPSEGFTTLWERGRLDLTVEAHVIDPQYADLFSDEMVDTARRRLAAYGYRGDFV
jgi:hypothetical protein